MNIHLICWARNEADILEAHVRHHAAMGATLEYVLHRCIDNSKEILASLATEGLPVTFREDDRILHEQKQVMAELLTDAVKRGVDWILPLDADEFLCGDVRQCLQEHSNTLLSVGWQGYVPTKEDVYDVNVLRRITHRRCIEQPQWSKVIVPVSMAKDERCILEFGNHFLLIDGKRDGGIPMETLKIAHFPVRSDIQLRRKVFGGWLSHLADPKRGLGSTFQWEAIYDALQKDSLCLTNTAIFYASQRQWESLPGESKASGYFEPKKDESIGGIIQDPVPCSFDIRYKVKEADPLRVLLETAEAIALSHAVLARSRLENG